MRRLALVLVSAFVAAGCARSAPVDVAMVSAHDEPTHFAFVPQYVDVRHADRGWQRVPLATSAAKMELLEYGHRVQLATSNLPTGHYTALRVGYLVPAAPEPRVQRTSATEEEVVRRTTKTRTLGDVQLAQQELTILRAFCVDRKGDDNALTFQVFRAHPSHPEDGPSVTVVQTPSC